MKIIDHLVIIIVPLITTTFPATANDDIKNMLEYCDQQLIQASINCSNNKELEKCIRDYLAEGECQVEVESESNVDICNEKCVPSSFSFLFDDDN